MGTFAVPVDETGAHTKVQRMATMAIRTTVAFDPATVARWERLTVRWGTSKSETLRRALEAADREVSAQPGERDFDAMPPMEIFAWLEANPLQPSGAGARWSAEIRNEREAEAMRADVRPGGANLPVASPDA